MADAARDAAASADATVEYLLEVRAEEIPARMVEAGVRRLATRLFEELMGKALGPREVETGYTPRRLLVVLKGLPEKERDRDEEVVGPPASVAFDADGEPTKAAEGFARRLGVEPGELQRIDTDKGEYVGLTRRVTGRRTADVLAELVPQILTEIPWPKTMRWGTATGPWVRPVHGFVSLLTPVGDDGAAREEDAEVVPFELFGVAAGRTTVGHPILSPEPFEVTSVASYREALAERGLVVEGRERSRILSEAMAEKAAAAGGTVVEDEDLLAKLTAMCEIPGVLEGAFDEAYLELPREILVASLKDHQSAFTVEDEAGDLLGRFLTVMDRPDDPAGRVKAGNEWVVAARLADARFFWGEDRKRSLAERRGDLESLTFHVRLGSYAAKTERLERLAGIVCRHGAAAAEAAGNPDAAAAWSEAAEPARAAARLLKVDLTTEVVKEFTSLQGVMGGIYAREDGEPEPVWRAIYDQYRPASTDDDLPRGRVGRAVALADRLDTLAGIFGLGLIPSGSRDPFGLRRAATGAVRIALEGELAAEAPLDLAALAAEAVDLYADGVLERGAAEVLTDLEPFFEDRIRHLLGLAGLAYDEIEAALAAGWSDLPGLVRRAEALATVREEGDFLALVLAVKRIENITQGAEAADAVDGELLEDGAERALFEAHREAAEAVDAALAEGDSEAALRRLAALAPVLDEFFDEVLVMADDEAVRANRLALLAGIGATASRVGALTEMVVDRDEHRRRHGGGDGDGDSDGDGGG